MPRKPNILLITLDQWRGDCLGVFDHPCVRTPHLDALARRGVAFRRHYSQAAPCGPARASLLTGLYLHNHRVVRNGTPLEARHITLALEARKSGYEPVLFGYTDTAADPTGRAAEDPALATYEGMAPGFTAGLLLPEDNAAWRAHLKANGFAVPPGPKDVWLPDRARPGGEGGGPSFAPTRFPDAFSETNFLTDAAIRHLAVARAPFFLHLSYIRPHPPFIAPEPWNALIDPAAVPKPLRAADLETEAAQHPWLAAHLERIWAGPMPIQEKPPLAGLSDPALAQLRATYYGMIAQVDDAVGRLLAALEAEGKLQDTLVVVTADHGEMLGDHWMFGKDGYFDQSFHIPLIVADPSPTADRSRGRVVDAFSESVDVMPTILERIGRIPPPACDGRSLMPFLTGDGPDHWRRHAHWEFDFRSVRSSWFEDRLGLASDECHLAVIRDEAGKYVHFAGLPPLFFDLTSDPGERVDRSRDPACADRVRDYAQALLTWRMRSEARGLTHVHLGEGGAVQRLDRASL